MRKPVSTTFHQAKKKKRIDKSNDSNSSAINVLVLVATITKPAESRRRPLTDPADEIHEPFYKIGAGASREEVCEHDSQGECSYVAEKGLDEPGANCFQPDRITSQKKYRNQSVLCPARSGVNQMTASDRNFANAAK